MVIKPSQQLDPESLAHPSMYGSTTNSNNKETLTLANSPNLSRFVHQHASESPDDTVLLVPEESPRPFAMQSPGKGWLPCTWSDLSDFIAELVLDFEQQPQIGSALGRSDHPVAAMLVSPAEDVLRRLSAFVWTHTHTTSSLVTLNTSRHSCFGLPWLRHPPYQSPPLTQIDRPPRHHRQRLAARLQQQARLLSSDPSFFFADVCHARHTSSWPAPAHRSTLRATTQPTPALQRRQS